MQPDQPNLGEGDRDADERYRDEVRAFFSKGKTRDATKDARAVVALDPDAGRPTDEIGRRGPRTTIDAMLAKSRGVISRVKQALHDRFSSKHIT